jgi:hypothetical protein
MNLKPIIKRSKWKSQINTISPDIALYRIYEDDRLLSNKSFIELLNTSTDFVLYFNAVLKNSLFEGYFWEVKPVKTSNLADVFEFVLVSSDRIALRKPNPRPFLDFVQDASHAIAFPNLGKNARLIAPAISGKPRQYAHISGFVRNAPEAQLLYFWQLVGSEFKNAINEDYRWLSTAGFGVSWLHVRIDTRPKYYRYKAYKVFT